MTIILAPSTKTKFVFAFGKLKFAFEFAPETAHGSKDQNSMGGDLRDEGQR